ncbi:hypothetical protein ACP4OV_014665 [Aristida adscensionis]
MPELPMLPATAADTSSQREANLAHAGELNWLSCADKEILAKAREVIEQSEISCGYRTAGLTRQSKVSDF